MTGPTRVTAAEAMAKALEVEAHQSLLKQAQSNHEDICGIRYAAINKTLGMIVKILGFGGSIALTIIIGLLAWSMQENWKATQAAQHAAEERLHQIEQSIQRASPSNNQDTK